MMSSVACHHRPWAALTIARCQAWNVIIAIGKHTRSNDIWINMPSLPLDSRHGRKTSGVASVDHPRKDIHGRITSAYGRTSSLLGSIPVVKRGMPSFLLGSIHGRTTSAVVCYHLPWIAHFIELRRAWQCYNCPWAAQTVGRRGAFNAIISLG